MLPPHLKRPEIGQAQNKSVMQIKSSLFRRKVGDCSMSMKNMCVKRIQKGCLWTILVQMGSSTVLEWKGVPNQTKIHLRLAQDLRSLDKKASQDITTAYKCHKRRGLKGNFVYVITPVQCAWRRTLAVKSQCLHWTKWTWDKVGTARQHGEFEWLVFHHDGNLPQPPAFSNIRGLLGQSKTVQNCNSFPESKRNSCHKKFSKRFPAFQNSEALKKHHENAMKHCWQPMPVLHVQKPIIPRLGPCSARWHGASRKALHA